MHILLTNLNTDFSLNVSFEYILSVKKPKHAIFQRSIIDRLFGS